MARPVVIRNDVILSAARKVFLRYGFQAPTARIAREAGISEGSIFKHFKTKSDLFLAALQVESKVQSWEDQLMRSVGAPDIRKTLEVAGLQMLRRFQRLIPCLVMIRSSGITIAGGGSFSHRPPPEIKIITAYIKAEAREGRLVVRHPEAFAHAFVGALSHYAFCETTWGYRPVAPRSYIRVIVNTFLKAVMPGKPRSPRKK